MTDLREPTAGHSRSMKAVSRWYLVASPEWEWIDRIMDDGSGPSEWNRDVIYVRTRNAKRAKVVALRHFRRVYPNHEYLLDGTNPLCGMQVERMDCSLWPDPTDEPTESFGSA